MFANHPQFGGLARLSDDLFVFRAVAGSGCYWVGTLEELAPKFLELKVSEPYRPPAREPHEADGMLTAILEELGL